MSEVGEHLRQMELVGLLVALVDSPEIVYLPSPDALVRFGSWAVSGGWPESGGVDPGDHTGFLGRLVDELADLHHDVLSPATVGRFVQESYQLLAARATVRQHLPGLTARFASERLMALTTPQGRGANRRQDVLFVCRLNAGRSQVAAALLRRAAGDTVRVRTAGSTPATALDPVVRAELVRRGLDRLTEFPRPLTDEVVRASSVVVTMGCGDACPVVPGRHYLDWAVPDPAGQAPRAVRAIVDDIQQRVERLLIELRTG